jgi:D-glycero-alpha-D-manno-heptose-7-phosphate kinase
VIISRTPLRISLAGGGSDLSAFYRRESGAVVSCAIDKYITIAVNEKFDGKVRASYSTTEIVDEASDLKHDLIRESLAHVNITRGIEVVSISDVPGEGTGLGSSSSYTVGLLNALYVYRNARLCPERLAYEACCVEIEDCGRPIGKQDQTIAAFGGVQFIRFSPDETVAVEPAACNAKTLEALQDNLLLLYTGITRSAGDILRVQQANMAREAVRANVREMVRIAYRMRECLRFGNVDAVGELLHQGWLYKRALADGITSKQIDAWYNAAREAGAVGGKLLGAGGGGFLLFYAPADRHDDITNALGLRRVPFKFAHAGSQIVYAD